MSIKRVDKLTMEHPHKSNTKAKISENYLYVKDRNSSKVHSFMNGHTKYGTFKQWIPHKNRELTTWVAVFEYAK